MRKLILLVSFAAFACSTPGPGSGPGPGPGPGPGSDAAPPGNDQGLTMLSEELKNGSRLHNKLVNGEDGSQSLIGLYDSLLQEDCAFALAEDNQQRCLPTRVAGINTQYYYDAACTKPVAISDSCLPAVKYARTVDPACKEARKRGRGARWGRGRWEGIQRSHRGRAQACRRGGGPARSPSTCCQWRRWARCESSQAESGCGRSALDLQDRCSGPRNRPRGVAAESAQPGGHGAGQARRHPIRQPPHPPQQCYKRGSSNAARP